MTSASDNSPVHLTLLADMRLALLSEMGARSIYGYLAARMRDAELRQVLARLHEEEAAMIATVQSLLVKLGSSNVPQHSRRRAIMAWVLARSSGGRTDSLALRNCQDSELTVARWYAEYARYLAVAGKTGEARVCEELAQTKLRHARILDAWSPRWS